MDSEEQTQFWRVVVRVSLIVGIVAALITIFGVLHSFSSPGQSAASNSTSTSQATSTLAADGPTATATIVPTSTPRPKPGDILYQANWSSGLNGWAGTSDWQTLNGKLLNNGQADQPSTILAPFNSGGNGVSDYAVQASIQLIRTTIAQWNAFGIVVRSPDVDMGYTLGICPPYSCNTDQNIAMLGMADQGMMSASILTRAGYQPGSTYHTYRIEVRGNTITGYIDGGQVLQTTDNTYLVGGRVGLWCGECQVSVQSFKVYAI